MSPLRVECCRAATTVIIAGGRIGCRVGEGGPPAGSEVMDPEPGLPNGSSPEPRRRAEAPQTQRKRRVKENAGPIARSTAGHSDAMGRGKKEGRVGRLRPC